MTTVFVCISCGAKEGKISRGRGADVLPALQAALADTDIDVRPVSCLSNCDRGVSVAFTAPEKFSWLFGEKSESAEDVAALAAAAKTYATLPGGFLAKIDRPKPVIARMPPAGFVAE